MWKINLKIKKTFVTFWKEQFTMTRRQSVNQTKLTVEFFLGWPTSKFYLLLNYFVRKWSSFIAYTKKLLHSISHNKHLGPKVILPVNNFYIWCFMQYTENSQLSPYIKSNSFSSFKITLRLIDAVSPFELVFNSDN